MGSRLLRHWLQHASREQAVARHRHTAIASLIERGAIESLREALSPVPDIERIATRIALLSARPRDLSALRIRIRHDPETLVGRYLSSTATTEPWVSW